MTNLSQYSVAERLEIITEWALVSWVYMEEQTAIWKRRGGSQSVRLFLVDELADEAGFSRDNHWRKVREVMAKKYPLAQADNGLHYIGDKDGDQGTMIHYRIKLIKGIVKGTRKDLVAACSGPKAKRQRVMKHIGGVEYRQDSFLEVIDAFDIPSLPEEIEVLLLGNGKS